VSHPGQFFMSLDISHRTLYSGAATAPFPVALLDRGESADPRKGRNVKGGKGRPRS